jgi:hypothetical protein
MIFPRRIPRPDRLLFSNWCKFVSWGVIICFTIASMSSSYAQGTLLLICDSSGCKEPKTARQKKKATHLGLTIKDGNELLRDRRLHAISKEKADLYRQKLQIKNEIISWHKIQMKQAYKTVELQHKSQMVLKEENGKLNKENDKLKLDVAKYKGQRFTFLMVGVGVGVGVTLGVIVGVALYRAGK